MFFLEPHRAGMPEICEKYRIYFIMQNGIQKTALGIRELQKRGKMRRTHFFN
jgi:hypothetical protein